MNSLFHAGVQADLNLYEEATTIYLCFSLESLLVVKGLPPCKILFVLVLV